MKCRLHSTDLSSTIGVCASCLRERLFLIISTQSQQQIHQLQVSDHDPRRNSDPPPPLVFPRSVSPYVFHRQSNGVSLDFTDRRFHSTPQIGDGLESESMKKKKRGRFSFITSFFKSRSDKSETDPRTASTSSPFWSSGSKSKSLPKFVGQRIPNSNQNQNHRVSDRGMSPCNNEREEESSSRSSDSYEQPWKQTPVVPITRRRHSNISGLAFCLSPLVRASPNRNWNRNSLPPESGGGGGDCGVASRKAVANSLCKNRSKKIADFGRGSGFDNRR